MGIFDGIKDAPMPGGGNYFNPGVYLLELVLAKSGESAQGKGAYVAIEGEVLETLVPFPAGRISDVDGKPIPASNMKGERVSNVIMLRNKPAFGNVKAFLHASTGVDPKDVTAAVAERAFSGDGTQFGGVKVIARASQIKTKAGSPFTKVQWEPVPTEAPAAEEGGD